MKSVFENLKGLDVRQKTLLAVLAGCMLLTEVAFHLNSIVLVVIGLAAVILSGASLCRASGE